MDNVGLPDLLEPFLLDVLPGRHTLQERYDVLKNQVKRHPDAMQSALPEVITDLNFTAQPVAYAILLVLEDTAVNDDAQKEEWIINVSSVFHSGSIDMIKKFPEPVIDLARQFSSLLLEADEAIRGVQPLKTLLTRLAPKTTFTAIHTEFAKLALAARMYRLAEPVVLCPIYNIDSKGAETEGVMAYLYYKAKILIGTREHRAALHTLDMLINYPGDALSAIALAGCKLYVLLTVIVHGRTVKLEKSSTVIGVASTIRSLLRLCSAYTRFASAVVEGQNVDEALSEYTDQFKADKTFGLAKQCVVAAKQHRIRRLTKTFITLSLHDIAQRAHLQDEAEALKLLAKMIQEGQMRGRIDQQSGIVSFSDTNTPDVSDAALQSLQENLNKTAELYAAARKVNEAIETSKMFVKHRIQAGGTLSMDFDMSSDMDM